MTNQTLSDEQLAAFERDGFVVLPGFVDDDACLELRERALEPAKELTPSPEDATIFTTDGTSQHIQDEYFLGSGDKIRCFFEKGAFGDAGRLRDDAPSTWMEVLDPAPYPVDDIVPVEARRGTLVLLHGTLPHLSGPNLSDKPRHAYTLHAIDGTAEYPRDNWLLRSALMPMHGFVDAAGR